MRYWRVDRYEWEKKNPYTGPWESIHAAEDYCERVQSVHRDEFAVYQMPDNRWNVVQDVRRV